MEKIATFTKAPGRYSVRFTYDAEAVELLKISVPSSARSWDKAARCWLIDRAHVKGLARALRGLGYRIVGVEEAPPPPRSSTVGSWAAIMFAALPERLHEPVFRALTKVLHPDAGGDLRAAQQLNDARPARRRGAA